MIRRGGKVPREAPLLVKKKDKKKIGKPLSLLHRFCGSTDNSVFWEVVVISDYSQVNNCYAGKKKKKKIKKASQIIAPSVLLQEGERGGGGGKGRMKSSSLCLSRDIRVRSLQAILSPPPPTQLFGSSPLLPHAERKWAEWVTDGWGSSLFHSAGVGWVLEEVVVMEIGKKEGVAEGGGFF